MKSFKKFLMENNKQIKKMKPLSNDTMDSPEWKSFNNSHYDCLKLDKYGNPKVKLSGHQYVYHATTIEHANNILQKGIRKSGISLTGNPHEGRGYAFDRKEVSKKGIGVLIRVHKRHLLKGTVRFNDNGETNNLHYMGNIPKKALKIVGIT